MKRLALGLALSFVLAGAAPIPAKAWAAPNTLTPAEKAAGWTLLYDGKSLAGWRGFKTAAPDKGWTAADGVLSPDPKTSKDLVTKANYENFELTFEWKISPKGNSGVMFHVIPVGEETYESGPEYQLLDNARGEPPLERAGSLFALYAPVKDVPKPVGEWNQSRLVVDHGKCQHWLNGVKVAEYDEIARVVTESFPKVPGLQRTQTLTAFRAYSKKDLQQAWDIGVE